MNKFLAVFLCVVILYLIDGCGSSPAMLSPGQKLSVTLYEDPNKMPSVPPTVVGGISSILQSIKTPEGTLASDNDGEVIWKVYLSESGNIMSYELVKSAGEAYDQAALLALSNVRYTPGKLDGKPVKTAMTIPLTFFKR